MNTYKVIFADNRVLSCKLVNNPPLRGLYQYEHTNGQLTYALVKADSESRALVIARNIIRDVNEKVFVQVV